MVSVIVLLLGIGFVGTSSFIRAAKTKQVEAMMQGLIGANDEFKAQRQQGKINHGGDFPIRWSGVSLNLTSGERFVYACRQNKAAESLMLTAVNSGENEDERASFQDRDGDGVQEIYDVWAHRSCTANPITGRPTIRTRTRTAAG